MCWTTPSAQSRQAQATGSGTTCLFMPRGAPAGCAVHPLLLALQAALVFAKVETLL